MMSEGPYVCYPSDQNGDALFIRRCSKCNRFVKSDDLIMVNEETGLKPGPNATCGKCGRVEMIFQGFL